MDKLILDLQQKFPLKPLQKGFSVYEYLIKAIIYQQLSTKAANAIYNRFIALFENGKYYPGEVTMVDDERLRSCGISYSKIKYLKNIDVAFTQPHFEPSNWMDLSDEEIISKLTSIKGVGEWTAQMVLIFALHKPDVWPVKDLGVKMAYVDLIGSNKKGKELEKEMESYSAKWRGYRSTVARLFWAFRNSFSNSAKRP